ENFIDVIFDEIRVFHGGSGGDQGQDVHAEGRLRLAEPLDVFSVGEKTAAAHAGHAVNLRKRAADEKVWIVTNAGQHRDAAEFEVGFVNEDGSVRRGIENPLEKVVANGATGWIIRIRDEDGARVRADRGEELICGEIEIVEKIDFANRGVGELEIET